MTTSFDPNAAATEDSGIYGLPFTPDEAQLVLLPVPWEATTSYGSGASLAPDAIFNASKQVDLFDIDLGNFFLAGIAMIEQSPELLQWNKIAKEAAQSVIDAAGKIDSPNIQAALLCVNQLSKQMNEYVYTQTKQALDQGKMVGIIGGDHSVPFGAIQAYLEKYPNMGVLHIDAHADLRDTYEGFEYSHASIMHNVMTQTALSTVVQVGIRDFCEEEMQVIHQYHSRIKAFFDVHLAEQKMQGKSWSLICDEIVMHLPNEVYISFDIDGLDPRFCPHTGTPVPGGLDYPEVLLLIKKVAQSGRKIVGFDLNEVSPGNKALHDEVDTAAEWDANVGARILYKLCGWTLQTNNNNKAHLWKQEKILQKVNI